MPSKEALGIYYLLHPDDSVRFITRKSAVWEDGQKRPEKTGQRIRHKTAEFQCIRYDYDFQIGWQTLQSADYKVLLANTNAAENACMIDWTDEVLTLGETAGNWGANTADAADLAGGAQWDAGTPENPVLKKSLGQIAQQINLVTNGVVADYENVEDVGLILVLSPTAAVRMASSPEVHAIYKESLYADALVTRGNPNPNGIWQLPPYLYGFKIVIEDTVYVSENPEVAGGLAVTTGATPTRKYRKAFDSAIICSRVGGIEGQLGAPNFSTFQRYVVDGKDMQVSIFDEKKHEYTDGHVVKHGVAKLAAPASGFLVTRILNAA